MRITISILFLIVSLASYSQSKEAVTLSKKEKRVLKKLEQLKGLEANLQIPNFRFIASAQMIMPSGRSTYGRGGIIYFKKKEGEIDEFYIPDQTDELINTRVDFIIENFIYFGTLVEDSKMVIQCSGLAKGKRYIFKITVLKSRKAQLELTDNYGRISTYNGKVERAK